MRYSSASTWFTMLKPEDEASKTIVLVASTGEKNTRIIPAGYYYNQTYNWGTQPEQLKMCIRDRMFATQQLKDKVNQKPSDAEVEKRCV